MDPPLATPVLFYALVLCSLPDFERTLPARRWRAYLAAFDREGHGPTDEGRHTITAAARPPRRPCSGSGGLCQLILEGLDILAVQAVVDGDDAKHARDVHIAPDGVMGGHGKLLLGQASQRLHGTGAHLL